ncbi:LOW QUALITY PROTEIN: hypothetical protein U9M48_034053 [Paspalum notatum var. saurae]|uniref:At1g61320/AtMIF1 LRR domain-containing protein n=1 Tax=Paspalum notatum var. saurae TaxID=547442 RepID=A0AAQ3X8J3_PASNO
MQVNQDDMKHASAFGDGFHVRQIPGHKHSRLRKVQINGFCSAKSMVELTCHILENATPLESLTLDTIIDQFADGDGAVSAQNVDVGMWPILVDMVLEEHKALRVVNMYIVGRVPPAVKFNVWEPCSRCHDIVDVKLLDNNAAQSAQHAAEL